MAKYIIFSIGNEYYAVNILSITCIEDGIKPVPVHGAPGYIKGLMNLRGQVIPVVSLRYVFGCEEKGAVSCKTLVTDIGDIRLGLMVDDVIEIYTPTQEDLCEIPPLVRCPATEYAEGVIKKDEKLLISIVPDKILSKAELGDIDKILAGV
jgi:purine-binding chemotaxis protein CheW